MDWLAAWWHTVEAGGHQGTVEAGLVLIAAALLLVLRGWSSR